MGNNITKGAAADLGMDDCIALIRACRNRIGQLTGNVPDSIRAKCKVGRTASLVAKSVGKKVTGVVEEIVGGCVALRFSCGAIGYTTMDKLDPGGFGRPQTPLPPMEVSGLHPDDGCEVEMSSGDGVDLPILFGGILYMPTEVGDTIIEARRIMMSVMPEYLPTSAVVRLRVCDGGDREAEAGIVCL